MNFDKMIVKLFKMNRDNYNLFAQKVEKLLREVYEKGITEGRKQRQKELINLFK